MLIRPVARMVRKTYALVVLCALYAGLTFVPEHAAAQFVHPVNCLPPVGQGMWEIAATNLARRYRSTPTPENREAMCDRYKSTIKVYEDAVEGCKWGDCKETSYVQACARVKEKVVYWHKRTKEECG